jgi:hypothetical protein
MVEENLTKDRGELVDEFVDGLFFDGETEGYTHEAVVYARRHPLHSDDPEAARRFVSAKVEWLYALLDRIGAISEDISERLLAVISLNDFMDSDDSKRENGSYQVDRVLEKKTKDLVLKGDGVLQDTLGKRFANWFESNTDFGWPIDSRDFVNLRLIVEVSDALEEFSDVEGLEVDLMVLGILNLTIDDVKNLIHSLSSRHLTEKGTFKTGLSVLQSFQRAIAELKGEKNGDRKAKESFARNAAGHVITGRKALG